MLIILKVKQNNKTDFKYIQVTNYTSITRIDTVQSI